MSLYPKKYKLVFIIAVFSLINFNSCGGSGGGSSSNTISSTSAVSFQELVPTGMYVSTSNTSTSSASPESFVPSPFKQTFKNLSPQRSTEAVSSNDLSSLVDSINKFGLKLYKRIDQSYNVAISPYSAAISIAAASTAASGRTLEQILQTMEINISKDILDPAFNDLDMSIAGNGSSDNITPLKSIQSAWGQDRYYVFTDYYNKISNYYGMNFVPLDFVADSWQAKNAIELSINALSNLKFTAPAGSLYPLTRIVLSNLASMDATWESPFNSELTYKGDFNGSRVSTPFLSQIGYFRYVKEDGMQAVEIPFKGGRISALLILPDKDTFSDFESRLTVSEIKRISGILKRERIELRLPSFSADYSYNLANEIAALGGTDAFAQYTADFTKANDADKLYISKAVSETKHRLNEAGWVGESSTVVALEGLPQMPQPSGNSSSFGLINTFCWIQVSLVDIDTSPKPIDATFDHTFLYIVSDIESGVILFIGKVKDLPS